MAIRSEELVKRCAGSDRHDLVLAEQEALKTADDAGDIVRSVPKVSVTMSQLRECQTLQRISALVKVLIDGRAAFYINAGAC